MNDINVGDGLTDPWGVPVGTVITHENTRALRTPDGWLTTQSHFRLANGLGINDERAGDGYDWRIASVPEVAPQETINQWLQRVDQTVWGRAQINGMERRPIERALEQFDQPDFNPSLGMWINTYYRKDVAWIPTGALIEAGNPDDWDLYSLWQWTGREWMYVTGGHGAIESGRLIEAEGVGTEDYVLDREYDEVGLHNMKVALWDIATTLKDNTGWCGEVHATVRRLGCHAHMSVRSNEEAAA